jgi:NADH-quinone oxidoreductase subunit E
MSLETKYPNEVKLILSKYPPEHKRSAVMPLLFLAQREEGYLSKTAMQDVAQIVGISETDVAALVGFYTLFHEKKGGKYRIQVCTDLPCALRGADEFMKSLCDRLGMKAGETSEDGFLTVEAVTCLAACDKAPMFQTQGPDGIKYYENMTVDRTMELISVLRRSGREVRE